MTSLVQVWGSVLGLFSLSLLGSSFVLGFLRIFFNNLVSMVC